MKYFSLFSGIGGFEYGIERAYEEQTHFGESVPDGRNSSGVASREGRFVKPECVGYSEIDKYAQRIYRQQFGGRCENTKTESGGSSDDQSRTPQHVGRSLYQGGHKAYGDITKIETGTIPDFDLLVGGFPCQAFSITGLRRGFEDARGTLFFEIARILRDKRPRYLLLENVKGLLSHDSGKTFQTILGVLTELGYDTQWAVLNSKNFGVPQNRERVFFAGCLTGWGPREVFSFEEGHERYSEKIQQRLTIRGRNKNAVGCLDTRGVNAFDRSDLDRIIYGSRIRRLTPIECERLQGFPDNWTKLGIDEDGNEVEISDSQRYKCLGNAVTTNVVAWVVRRMFL